MFCLFDCNVRKKLPSASKPRLVVSTAGSEIGHMERKPERSWVEEEASGGGGGGEGVSNFCLYQHSLAF